MKITYLGHSGFFIEMQEHLLLFDYYTGVLPGLDPQKKLMIFVSHHHPDHMNYSIFSLCAAHPNVHYIFSDDVYVDLSDTNTHQKLHFVKPEREYALSDCKVTTLRSTDCGVAFLVNCEGKNIFHAGDLNLWLWQGMDKMSSLEMMGAFTKYTAPLKNKAVAVAFLTLDTRLGKTAYCNIDHYMRSFSIDLCIPMHYFGSSCIADQLIADPCSEPYREKIRKLDDGECVIL